MNKQFQVTIYNNENKYKPISTIVSILTSDESSILLTNRTSKLDIINKGVKKICNKRYWTADDLKKYGYTKAKVREYEKNN